MKVLVISHNVFNQSSNMGKTLYSYFSDFSKYELAQFYIQAEVPTERTICTNYYRFTDIDAIKSIVNRKHGGVVFREDNIDTERKDERTDTGMVRYAYNAGAKNKTWAVYLRNIAWSLSSWKSKKLQSWIDEVSPDVIFFEMCIRDSPQHARGRGKGRRGAARQ